MNSPARPAQATLGGRSGNSWSSPMRCREYRCSSPREFHFHVRTVTILWRSRQRSRDQLCRETYCDVCFGPHEDFLGLTLAGKDNHHFEWRRIGLGRCLEALIQDGTKLTFEMLGDGDVVRLSGWRRKVGLRLDESTVEARFRSYVGGLNCQRNDGNESEQPVHHLVTPKAQFMMQIESA